MNLELKIEYVRQQIRDARAKNAPIDDLKILEKRLNDLWIRLMAIR